MLANRILRDNADQDQTKNLMSALQPMVAFIILCSVLVHGLSICTFSLGKRIRTLSRTSSSDSQTPEWLNQTRRAEIGSDDIQVNRESDMEKGEAIDHRESLHGRSSPCGSGTHVGSASESVKNVSVAESPPQGVQFPGTESSLPHRGNPLQGAEQSSGHGEVRSVLELHQLKSY